MTTLRITKRTVDALQSSCNEFTVWDNAVTGFGVRVRSTGAPRPARLVVGADGPSVSFDEPEEGVSPGQACVFYDAPAGQARVLGGGFIQSAARGSAMGPQPIVEAMRG